MVKKIKYKLEFIYSFRGMSSTYSGLVGNLPDSLHNDKCINCILNMYQLKIIK